MLQKLTTPWTIPFGMRKLLLVSVAFLFRVKIYTECITIGLHRKTIRVYRYFIRSFHIVRAIIPLSFKFLRLDRERERERKSFIAITRARNFIEILHKLDIFWRGIRVREHSWFFFFLFSQRESSHRYYELHFYFPSLRNKFEWLRKIRLKFQTSRPTIFIYHIFFTKKVHFQIKKLI